MDFGEILALSGLTQKQFSERYHIPFSTVNRWANGGKQTPYVLALLERFVREDAQGVSVPCINNIGIRRIIDTSKLTPTEFANKYVIEPNLVYHWVGNDKKSGYILYLLERAVKEDNRKELK